MRRLLPWDARALRPLVESLESVCSVCYDRFWTAIQALFHPTRLGLVEPPSKVSGNEWIFIYGGSSK